jgi:hypothetical protein
VNGPLLMGVGLAVIAFALLHNRLRPDFGTAFDLGGLPYLAPLGAGAALTLAGAALWALP